ncbi:MAG: RNA-processing protein [Nanoarchaeota archaeon]|jgi:ribosomal RNA assembly protein|nr:RNA-processing protein [Nanoarchaeota archaeon]|tara:strand:- start:52721 stop:53230 length:510 start_codon:yes stop_codon:yes gene_type:complete
MSELKIPKARIAVLVGVKGKTKRLLEKKTKTKLKIDSQEGLVDIQGTSMAVFQTELIIKAIGRGFNPEVALSLLDEENCFELIDITSFAGKSKDKLKRIKSRLIGTKGKCRKFIENMCDIHISIYGKTVSIIGKVENVQIARLAIQDILSGAPHGPVYKTLEEKMHSLK